MSFNYKAIGEVKATYSKALSQPVKISILQIHKKMYGCPL